MKYRYPDPLYPFLAILFASIILGILAALSLIVGLFSLTAINASGTWTVFAVSVAGLGIINVLQRIEKLIDGKEIGATHAPVQPRVPSAAVPPLRGGYQPTSDGTKGIPDSPPKHP